MSKIKFFFIGIIPGIIIGCIIMAIIMMPSNSDISTITTTQVSGEKIDHKKWSFSGSKITFNTEAQGRGEIKTEIPKRLIPEAAAWIEKNDAVGILLAEKFNVDDRKAITSIGLSWNHRWDSVEFGGGPIGEFTTDRAPKFHSIGAFLEAKYWFKMPAKKKY
ncbi:MAG TPA: hypothetical protein PK573_02280 [Spirochaetota bacterium]|nr:hypothetical protein [Spirochaetota bacterium]HRZ28706.1 hypothetical protein [Spirochaetota bacterium]